MANTDLTAFPILSGRFLVQMRAETNGCEAFCISLLCIKMAHLAQAHTRYERMPVTFTLVNTALAGAFVTKPYWYLAI